MAHDDFEIEPVRGLPEHLPQGEKMLWQGAPRTWALAKASMSIHWVIGYFVLLALWRGIAVSADHGVEGGLWAGGFYLILGAAAAGLILGSAWIFARTTVYTITSERVVLRVGAALTVTLNLPYRWIAKADLALAKDGTGSIHFDLKGDTRISYLVCWPHVRPWVIRRPQPSFRAIPDAARVARIIGAAAEAQVPQITNELADEAEPAGRPEAPIAGPVAVPAE